jgi:hypothetical protein
MTLRRLFCAAAFALAALAMAPAPAVSEWVYLGPDHKLHYKTDSRGNRIMDFSSAGYRGGGVALPVLPVAATVAPAAGDMTAQIQAAIDQVAHRQADAHGFRGAVLLQPGAFDLNGTLTIAIGGVVLRGSGSGDDGTTIRLTGSPHRFLEIRGSGVLRPTGERVRITDEYIPSGARSLHVENAGAFHAGDAVFLEKPVTPQWIHFMGMDTLVRDGKAQTWLKSGSVIRTDRVVESVAGKEITLDVPLSDSFDAHFFGSAAATVARYTFPGRIAEAGVENLRVAAPFEDIPITGPQFTVLRMDAVTDAWARDLDVRETQNGFTVGSAAKRVTLERVRVQHTAPHSGAAAPADFSISGTQILLDRAVVNGEGTWPVVTQATVTGPIVVLNFSGNAHAGVSPHQRWATGVLVDGAHLPDTVARTPGIAFSNRKTAGSGHGWDVGWAVGWNVVSPVLLVQQPPGAMNWCIGCVGEAQTKDGMPKGTFDSPGTPVTPASLYLEQLRERLGDAALKNIGY